MTVYCLEEVAECCSLGPWDAVTLVKVGTVMRDRPTQISMGKKRAQSPARSAAASKPAETEEGSSQSIPAEPPKEPTPPITVFYCQGMSFDSAG